MSQTLGDRFPLEIARVRELRDAYRDLGASGTFGLLHIQPLLAAAEQAWAEQDTVAMIRLYPQLVDLE